MPWHTEPDGAGLWQNESGHVLLGHRRLSIIDLSDAGHQPMHLNPCPSPQGEERLGVRYSIIHNGEIYNYIELKEELKKKGYHFHSQTDTEVIIAAYDCWQEDCVDHFDGMFAFAIWDEKEKTLFAARDRFGETDNPEHPGETFFENIYKLPPATTLTYHAREKKLMLQKFWDIDPDKQNKTITDNEAIEQFTHLFTTSIKRRLRSDVSIGTSLSGGLDSSSIVSQINDLQTINYKTQTFTALFPGFEKDEGNYSKQVASLYQLKQFNVNVTAEEMLND